jgi:hypothetical protein
MRGRVSRRRPEGAGNAPENADGARQRIEADLGRRGVAAEFSALVSRRLAPFAPELSAEAYEGVLSGIALAYGVHRQAIGEADPGELERLLGGFVEELRKLDEALSTLAAYVSRLGQRSAARAGRLH